MFVHTRVTCVHFSTVLQLFEQNVTIITNHPLHAIIPPKMFCEAEMYQFHSQLQASARTLLEKCSYTKHRNDKILHNEKNTQKQQEAE